MDTIDTDRTAAASWPLPPDAEPTPRLSPLVVLAVVAVLGWALNFLAEVLSRGSAARMGVLLLAASAAAGLVYLWNRRAGRWFTVAALAVLVLQADRWAGLPGSLAWLALPTGVAAALIGLRASLGVALAGTLLLLLPPVLTQQFVVPGADRLVPLGAIWAALGAMTAIYLPVYRRLERWEVYFKRARAVVEEAKEHRGRMNQALADLHNANRQLALAGDRMAALRAIAEEARAAKAAFVAKVSHELRTPLHMITGLVNLMVNTPEIYDVVLPPEMRDDLETVHRNCTHLTGMINDVLSLSQDEAGRLVLHREWVDLRRLVDDAVALVRPLTEKKGLFLRVEAPGDLPRVHCDATRIRQVVLNLVSNAARFTDEGGITVRAEHSDQHVVVGVTDTGPGIAEEDARVIFEPFFQASSEPWRDRGGSGLGLAVSRHFVRAHGGRMWLESEVGDGSSFYFELPLSPPAGHLARPGHRLMEDWEWREAGFRTEQAIADDRLARPRLVLCDATGALQERAAGVGDDVEIVHAATLAQAVASLEQCPAHAVVLNAPTPGELWPLVEQARAVIPDTPVVGCSLPRPDARVAESGAAGYLIKPVTQAALEDALRGLDGPVRRVLLVDDDADVRRLFLRMLRVYDATLSVSAAGGGEQALAMARADPPDLVLLDVFTPGMDGWGVLEQLRRCEAMADVPVLFVSAHDPVEQQPESPLLLVARGDGFSLNRVLGCSLALSRLLLGPADRPGPGP